MAAKWFNSLDTNSSFPPLLNLSTRLSTTALPGQTTKMAQTLESMFQNVAYRPTVYRTGVETIFCPYKRHLWLESSSGFNCEDCWKFWKNLFLFFSPNFIFHTSMSFRNAQKNWNVHIKHHNLLPDLHNNQSTFLKSLGLYW